MLSMILCTKTISCINYAKTTYPDSEVWLYTVSDFSYVISPSLPLFGKINIFVILVAALS